MAYHHHATFALTYPAHILRFILMKQPTNVVDRSGFLVPDHSHQSGTRVLIMSVSAGAGHVKAASALEKTFTADARVTDVINMDALQYTNKLFRDFYSKFYNSLVNSAPNFLGWWYKTSDEPWRTDKMRIMLDRLNTRPLVKLIRAFDPHIIVCTHFMPAGIISHLIATKKLQAKLSIVVTDFNFHAMWLSRAFHRYFVALEETKAYLTTLGLPSERITVSGIPIDPKFQDPINRIKECNHLNLNPEKPIILLSAGASGIPSTEFMVERLFDLHSDTQIIVVCGRNELLTRKINELTKFKQNQFKVIGYTDKMHELMKISTIIVTKPGGMTSAEALACGIPMCIVNPIPGQEERNCDHLLEQGTAVKCHELSNLPYKIQRLLDNPEKLRDMSHNSLKLAKIKASQTIADTLLNDNIPVSSQNNLRRYSSLL